METLERLAGRLACDLNRLDPAASPSQDSEEILKTASLVIKLADELAGDRAKEAGGVTPSQGGSADAVAETILLVDGEREDRLPVRDCLIHEGYRVIEAGSGSEALAAIEACPEAVCLLLTNVLLPDISGRELAERLALRWPRLNVIYMSGYADDEILYYGVLGPGVATISKPIRPAELVERVRAALEAPQYA